MKRFFIRPLSALGAIAVLLTGSLASAQDDRQVTVITTLPVFGLTTTTGVVMTVVDSTTSSTSTTRDILFGSTQHTTSYMANNANALTQDIVVGDGSSLKDLAQMAQIKAEDQGAFFAVLNNHSEDIIDLLADDNFGEQQALEITNIITDAMRENDQLKHYII